LDLTSCPAVSTASSVDKVIESRTSIRAFTQQPVSNEVVLDLLKVASRAPSGTNSQPWRAYVVRGRKRDELVEKVCAAHDEVFLNPERANLYKEEYDYYPRKWFDPYLARRRQNGFELYSLVGIEKGDKKRMHQQHQRNFKFFDAPVGIVFTVDRHLGNGSLVDYGMFLQSLMIAAKGRGIDTCPQAAWNNYGSIVLPYVGAGPDEMLLCGMAIGYAEWSAPENSMRPPREPAAAFTTILE